MKKVAINRNHLMNKIDFVKFVFPILLLYIVFFVIPFFQTVGYSFTSWNGIDKTGNFIGLNNYINIFKDDLFFNSMRFTLSYAVLYTVAVNILAILFAMLLTKNLKTKTVLRAIIFAPFVFNNVTVGFLWQFLLGRFMTNLYDLTNWGIFGVSWLADERIVLYSVICVKIWQSLGYFMVIYIAGLQMIPQDPIEASIIDGARSWRMAVNIILPLLMPTIVVCLFFSLTDALHMFPLLMTLTSGGPGHASESISLYIYNEAFKNQRMGYASALSVILACLVLLITWVQLRLSSDKGVVV